jgi:hypothetical protein
VNGLYRTLKHKWLSFLFQRRRLLFGFVLGGGDELVFALFFLEFLKAVGTPAYSLTPKWTIFVCQGAISGCEICHAQQHIQPDRSPSGYWIW